jgi:hypothetical protein
MYRVGLTLGVGFVVAGVIEWSLLGTKFLELIEKRFPWTDKVASPTGIWITLAAGILVFLKAWGERKREKRLQYKLREIKQATQPPPPVSRR